MSKTPFDNDNENTDDDLNIQDAVDLGAADEAVNPDEHRRIKDERDKLMYAVAEAQNMRKRLQTEKEQAVQYANQSLIRSLIPIIDNSERPLAVTTAKTDAASVLKGLQLVHDQLMKELKKQTVEVIAPHPNPPFAPNRHEAL